MDKPAVVLDTNIFISAVFWEGKPYQIVQKAISQEIIAFISEEIIQEIRRVLRRDFGLTEQEIGDIVDSIILFTHLIRTKEKVDVIKEDPDDNIILECALSANADYIITQDKHLLKLEDFRNIPILSPVDFHKIFKH